MSLSRKFSPAIYSQDIVNDAGYYVSNVTIKPVRFTEVNTVTGEVSINRDGSDKIYDRLCLIVSKLKGKEDEGTRSVVSRVAYAKDGSTFTVDDSVVLYMNKETLHEIYNALSSDKVLDFFQ